MTKNVGNGWEEVGVEETNPFELQLSEFCKLVKGKWSEIVNGEYGRLIIGTISFA